MVLVLVIGDFHVPGRASDLPKAFKKLMIPGRIQQILCTGNLTSQATYNYLRSVCPDVQVVQGDLDTVGAWPTSLVVTHGCHRIGLIHGHQAIPWRHPGPLNAQARLLNADILVYGHTHQLELYTMNNTFFVNPGTCTGAPSHHGPEIKPIPSFILMNVQDHVVTNYIYKLVDNDVAVEVMEFKKD